MERESACPACGRCLIAAQALHPARSLFYKQTASIYDIINKPKCLGGGKNPPNCVLKAITNHIDFISEIMRVPFTCSFKFKRNSWVGYGEEKRNNIFESAVTVVHPETT